MTQRRHAVVVVVCAMLVATAAPALAATADDVASIHTTDTELQNADTLDGLTVQGSGTSASADTTPATYNVIDDSGDGTVDDGNRFVGDGGGNNVWETETKIKPDFTGTIDQVTFDVTSVRGSDYGFTVDIYIVQENPDGTYGEGTLVKSGYDPDFQQGEQTVTLDTTYDVDAGTNYTIEWVTNSGDNDGSEDALWIGQDTSFTSTWWSDLGTTANKGGDITVHAQDSFKSAQYVGQNHTADGVGGGFADVTLDNATATAKFEYWNGSAWMEKASLSYSSSGNKSVTWTPTGYSTWRVNVTFTASSGVSSASLEDEGVLFDASAPSVNNSSMSPSGGAKITDQNPTLSIDVNDSDFATSQGDSVTVEFYINGSKRGEDTLTSNGTATYDVQSLDGGDHSWHAVATDSYGNSDTSATETFTAPGTLYIRNVSQPGQLVDSPVSVEIRFIQENGSIVERTTTTGKVDMSGLPADETIIVIADPDQDYAQQAAIITSLYDQQSVFLLNTTAKTSAAVTFELRDKTGSFPADKTYLEVQMAINQSKYSTGGSGTQWTTVAGDFFDASGQYDATLIENARYRLKITNQQNQSRILGQYVASDGELVPLPVGRVTFDTVGNRSFAAQASLDTDQAQDYLKVKYRDPASDTSKIVYNVTYRENNTVIFSNRTVQGPLGETVELLAVQNTTTNYQVTMWVYRNNEVIRVTRYAGQVPSIAGGWGVDDKWLTLMGWVTIVALTGLAVIVDPRLASIVAVGTATLLTWIGVVSLPGLALMLAGVTAIVLSVGGQ